MPDESAALRISDTLALPLDYATDTGAILAKRGAGKSNAAVVIAEEMTDAGIPWVALDPKGDWWGVRSNADGDGPGLPVVVFGGRHGDVPLPPDGGRTLARLISEQQLSAVLDLSELTEDEFPAFVGPFADELYRVNTAPLHVIYEECHAVVPQVYSRKQPDVARMVDAVVKQVKWGRTHGIGVTLVSQRSASVSKDVLTQVETLIALRTTGPHDQAAVRAWLDAHADARDITAQLSSLADGQALVVSPVLLDLAEPAVIQFRRRRTFDSGATPKVGQQRVEPRTLADVDLSAVRQLLADAIETDQANDPAYLRVQIDQLEAELGAADADLHDVAAALLLDRDADRLDIMARAKELTAHTCPPPPDPEPDTVSTDDVEALLRAVREATEAQGRASDLTTPLWEALIGSARTSADAAARQVEQVYRHGDLRMPERLDVQPRPAAVDVEPTEQATAGSGGALSKAQRLVLTVLAQYGEQPRSRVAYLAGYTASGGGFRNAVSALRTSGCVTGTDPLAITPAGRAALGSVDPLPTGRALIDHHAARLGKAERAVLDVLVLAYRARAVTSLDREALAQDTGYEPTGGGFRNALSKLRTLGLITGRDRIALHTDVRASL